jgi:glucosyl-dolichyl phosphate glucuronosyltransferase
VLLSVIIPTVNRACLVARLLDSLALQAKVEFPWEVLVVDNGSAGQTPDLVRDRTARLPVRGRFIEEPEPGLHRARHRGARLARGCYLAFLDDDMLLSPRWLEGINRLVSGQAQAVAGRVLPQWEQTPPAWLARLAARGVYGYLSLLDLGKLAKPLPPMQVFGCNLFMSKRLLLDLGGFHPDGMPWPMIQFRGDGECGLMRNFDRAGLQAWYDPVPTAYHLVSRERMTLRYLCRRAYCEGISASFAKTRASCEANSHMPLRPQPAALISCQSRSRKLVSLLESGSRSLAASGPILTYIRFRLRLAERLGYWYHQMRLARSPDLRQWVRRKHYLD